MRLIIDPQNFADYDIYNAIISNLIGSSVDSPFEWLSYKTFQKAVDIFYEPSTAIYYVYLLNSIIFSVAMMCIVKHDDVNSGGILMALAIFAPLLYFVTLRATPAYLLILSSILLLEKEKKNSSAVCLSVAIFYHISAIIPALIIIILMIDHTWVEKKSKYIALMVYIISTIQLMLFTSNYNLIPDWISDELNSLVYLEKYSSYTEISQSFSINHYVYLSLMLLIFYTLRKWNQKFPAVVYSYVHLMMLIYSVLMISPVVAYRLSFFFLFPLVLLLPWDEIFGKFKNIIYYFIAPLIFMYSVNGVLIR